MQSLFSQRTCCINSLHFGRDTWYMVLTIMQAPSPPNVLTFLSHFMHRTILFRLSYNQSIELPLHVFKQGKSRCLPYSIALYKVTSAPASCKSSTFVLNVKEMGLVSVSNRDIIFAYRENSIFRYLPFSQKMLYRSR